MTLSPRFFNDDKLLLQSEFRKKNINSNSIIVYVDRPQFSIEPGSYDNPITLEISCPNPNTTIYYTLNGDTPNQLANVYTEPIVLDLSLIHI